MQADDRIRLRHMVDAARAAQDFVAGRTRAELDTNRMLLFAVVRAIEVIGEAAARMSPEGRAALPDLPWPAIIGMRNRIVHAYFDIDHEVVWQTVVGELPGLVQVLEAALASE